MHEKLLSGNGICLYKLLSEPAPPLLHRLHPSRLRHSAGRGYGKREGNTDLKASDFVYCGKCGPWYGCPCNACLELVGLSVVNGKAAFKPSQ